MNRTIETPAVGEILREEFMEPLGISAYRLAKEIGVPTSRIQDILHGRRKCHQNSPMQRISFSSRTSNFSLTLFCMYSHSSRTSAAVASPLLITKPQCF